MLTLRIIMDVWIFALSRIKAAGRRYHKQQQLDILGSFRRTYGEYNDSFQLGNHCYVFYRSTLCMLAVYVYHFYVVS